MPLRIIPREEGFYDLFVRAAETVKNAADLLQEQLTNFGQRETLHERIVQLEHDGDEITHQVMRLINTTFVTPFDREDIYRLASQLDDVLDAIEAVSDWMVLHNIEEPLPEMAKQADVLCRAATTTVEALSKLRGFRGLEPYWVEINRLENEGDRIYRRTVAHLFSGDYKAMDVLKHKELVDELEGAIDGLENVANTIESIVLKHA
jgi:hypothetical protein